MDRAGHARTTKPTSGAQSPMSIAQASAAPRELTRSEAEVGDLRHDLHERHEWWLIEQYLEGHG